MSSRRILCCLETIALNNNQLTGTIPTNWNLRQLFYLDLGHNQLSGSLPSDWSEGRAAFIRLRVLYLDHNNLSGSVPSSLGLIGNGRITLLSLQNNALTGEFPGFPLHNNLLNVLEIHNNQFSSMDKHDICNQIVFNYGELVMLRADCDICRCKHFCDKDQCYEPPPVATLPPEQLPNNQTLANMTLTNTTEAVALSSSEEEASP